MTLCASSSCIVVPAAMRQAVPEANPGLFELGAALAFGGTAALHFLRDAAKTRPGEKVLVICAGSLPQILGSLVRTIGTSHRVLAGEAPERPADLATLVAVRAEEPDEPIPQPRSCRDPWRRRL